MPGGGDRVGKEEGRTSRKEGRMHMSGTEEGKARFCIREVEECRGGKEEGKISCVHCSFPMGSEGNHAAGIS